MVSSPATTIDGSQIEIISHFFLISSYLAGKLFISVLTNKQYQNMGM